MAPNKSEDTPGGAPALGADTASAQQQLCTWSSAVKSFGDKTMFIHEGQEMTFRDFGRRAAGLAKELQSLGVKPGDRVVTAIELSVEGYQALLAIWKVGAIAVPLHMQLVEEQLQRMVGRVEPTVCLVGPSLVDLYTGLDICTVMCANGRWESADDVESYPWAPEDTIMVMHSSGSTGDPKGVEIFASHFLGDVLPKDDHIGRYVSALRTLCYVPYCGGVCISIFFNSWKYGASIVIASKPVYEEGATEEWVDLVVRHNVESLVYFGTALAGIVHTGRQMPSLKVSTVIGVTVCESLLLQAMELAPNSSWGNVYALSETGIISVHLIHRARQPLDRANISAVGKPHTNVELRIDGPLKEVDGRQVGEVVAKTPRPMKGYWRSPAATAEVLVDGWMHTGDLGYISEDGNLFIVGRKKDVIILPSCNNIMPADIEDALASHSGVKVAAVVGFPAPEGMGEYPAAFVVGEVSEEELRAHLATKLAPFQMPKHICFLESMPLTGTNKISKQDLRRMARDL